MDNQKLKGYLIEKRKTYANCASALGISTNSFSNKMNGRSRFDIIEINNLVCYLGMPLDDAVEIFLSKNLH